jgi:phospholipid/cholesterol/gamma-HCH transport system permease protein
VSLAGKKTGFAGFLHDLGGITVFSLRWFREVAVPPFETSEFFKQCYHTGYKSLTLVGITAFIMGLVLTLQSRPTLVEFGAESWLPKMVAISVIREMGPMITALITAGKVGSGLGAEIGSMRVTEQIDAMEVSGINPFKYIIATRVMACTCMLPLLVMYSDLISLLGSFVGVNISGHVSLMLFQSQVFSSVEYSDFIPSLVKSYVFGYIIGMVGCYKGYHCGTGTEDVGRAANEAVVFASLMIFVADMLMVQLLEMTGILD